MSGDADLLINVVDASNPSATLSDAAAAGWAFCIVALNMLDIATSQHIDIDVAALSARLAAQWCRWFSTRADGIGVLKQMIDNHHINEQAGAGELPPPLLLKQSPR